MSLWRVRHNLTPFVEKSLIIVAVLAGLTVIYFAQAASLAVAFTWPISSVPGPITLDVDAWSRTRNAAYAYDYAVPPGWVTDDSDPSRVIVANSRLALLSGSQGSVLTLEIRKLGERQKVEDLVAGDFADARATTYAISVSGHPGIFALTFENGRIARQSAYIQRDRDILAVRGDELDPAVFATFVSNIKFFIP